MRGIGRDQRLMVCNLGTHQWRVPTDGGEIAKPAASVKGRAAGMFAAAATADTADTADTMTSRVLAWDPIKLVPYDR